MKGSKTTPAPPITNDKKKVVVYNTHEDGRIYIRSEAELLEWSIFDISGRLIHRKKIEISMFSDSYPSMHLPKGVYLVSVKTTEGFSSHKVLVF